MFIDLNADAGETEADQALFSLVSSVNLACCAHAGDEPLLRQALRLAREHGLQVGAHPGYLDRENFGRIETGQSPEHIAELVTSQLQLLGRVADEEGVALGHVKAHGALYNRVAVDTAAAKALAGAVARHRPGMRLFLPGGPAFARLQAALRGTEVRPVPEAFPDRAYLLDGTLAPRSLAGSVLHDPQRVARNAVAMARGEPFPILGGGSLTLAASTLCLHGDNPEAFRNAVAVRDALQDAGFRLRGVS